jgi:hypothetical protein
LLVAHAEITVAFFGLLLLSSVFVASERRVFPYLRGNVFCVLGLNAARPRPVLILVERLNIFWSTDRGSQLRDWADLLFLHRWPGAASFTVRPFRLAIGSTDA